MSKKIIYTCDKCKKEITGQSLENVRIIGSGTLVTLFYESGIGNNQFPHQGYHLHYACAMPIVRNIRKDILGTESEK